MSDGKLQKRIREVFKHDNWTEHLTEYSMTQTEVAMRLIDEAKKDTVPLFENSIYKDNPLFADIKRKYPLWAKSLEDSINKLKNWFGDSS